MADDVPTVSWSSERVSQALRLYILEGLTAAAVAEALGGVTRAAVIAKVRRLGHLKREVRRVCAASSLKGTAAQRLPRSRAELDRRRFPPQRPPVPFPPLREVPPTGAPVTLAFLPEKVCCWPIDDPGPGEMHSTRFCAGPVIHGRYCAAHQAIAVRRTDIAITGSPVPA